MVLICADDPPPRRVLCFWAILWVTQLRLPILNAGATERDLCENPMSQRYATIITDDDGREIVSAIGEFEGAAPEPRLGRMEPVGPGVLIGMVRDAAGGFCFPQAGIGEHAVLVLARLKVQAVKRAVAPAASAKPKRVKRVKVAKRKSRSKKPARSVPKAAAGAVDAPARDNG